MDFKRNQAPKEALGIGLFRKRDFEFLDDAKKWLEQNHVVILNLDGLCSPYPTPEQFAELRDYAHKYITITGEDVYDKSNKIVGAVANLYRRINSPQNRFKKISNEI